MRTSGHATGESTANARRTVCTPERNAAAKRSSADDDDMTGKRSRPDPQGETDQADVDSSEQGSPDMDDEGSFLHGVGDNYLMRHMDPEDRKIVAGALLGVDLAEVYSPARISKLCHTYKLIPGMAFDIQNGWDFTKVDRRMEAIRLVRRDEPLV